MPHARRTDANHSQVMAAFRRMGCAVADTSRLGGGFPDLCVAAGRVSVLVEVKDGTLSPSRRELTPDEKAFHRTFPVELVESMDDVQRVVSLLRRRQAAEARERMAD